MKFLFAKKWYRQQSIGDMKYKLFTLLAASFTMVVSGQDTKEKAPEADAKKEATADAKTEDAKEVAASAVAKSIAPVIQKFDGEKYAATKLAGNPDYYIMYFTASW